MKSKAYVKASLGAYSGSLNVYGADLLPADFDAAMAAARLAAHGWAEAPLRGSQSVSIAQPSRVANPPEAPVAGGALRDRVKLRTRSAERAARAVLQGRGYTVRKGPK